MWLAASEKEVVMVVKRWNWALGAIPLLGVFLCGWGWGKEDTWGFLVCVEVSRDSNYTSQPHRVYGHQFRSGYFLLAWDIMWMGSWESVGWYSKGGMG